MFACPTLGSCISIYLSIYIYLPFAIYPILSAYIHNSTFVSIVELIHMQKNCIYETNIHFHYEPLLNIINHYHESLLLTTMHFYFQCSAQGSGILLARFLAARGARQSVGKLDWPHLTHEIETKIDDTIVIQTYYKSEI